MRSVSKLLYHREKGQEMVEEGFLSNDGTIHNKLNGPFPLWKTRIGKKKQSHKLYRHALVHQLVQPLLELRSNPGQLNIPGPGRKPLRNDQRLGGKHFPQHTQKRKRCVVCAYQKNENGKYKDTKTVNYCPKCDKHICIGFFETYHTRSNF